MTEHPISQEVVAAVEEIKPLLAGRNPIVQSAILAELLGILLAGHWIPGEPQETKRLRQEILSRHCELAWELGEISSKMMGTNQ